MRCSLRSTREMPDGTAWSRPRAATSSGSTSTGVDAADLLARATDAGVTFVKGADFFPGGSAGAARAARLQLRVTRADRRRRRPARVPALEGVAPEAPRQAADLRRRRRSRRSSTASRRRSRAPIDEHENDEQRGLGLEEDEVDRDVVAVRDHEDDSVEDHDRHDDALRRPRALSLLLRRRWFGHEPRV